MVKLLRELAVSAIVMSLARAAAATPTPQQKCDYARVMASKAYVSCVEGVVGKDAKGISFDEFAAFAKCRHTYFKRWTAFQTNASLVTSTCQPGGGLRFVDNGDGTVTDNLTTLVWEKKTNLDGTQNYADPHDADNDYTWSTGGAPYKENGPAFTSFLSMMDAGGGFAGANGWRLPTIAELQTIVLDFACTGIGGGSRCNCPSSPCINPALDPANTQPGAFYWSATSYLASAGVAWYVHHDGTASYTDQHAAYAYVRAARGGL
jgi:hypothetical protein